MPKKGKAPGSKTVPDQSMSIREIVDRFVRGIPPDVVQRESVFVDQVDFDLEKLSRLDVTDKAYQSQLMQAENEQTMERIRDLAERSKERQEEQKAKEEASKSAPSASGIESLDNTMPDDTNLNDRPLPRKGQSVKGGVKN